MVLGFGMLLVKARHCDFPCLSLKEGPESQLGLKTPGLISLDMAQLDLGVSQYWKNGALSRHRETEPLPAKYADDRAS